MLQDVLSAYGLVDDGLRVEAFGTGLINTTWKVTAAGKSYILQRVNQAVFKAPRAIARNTACIAAYLKLRHPQYTFVAPLNTTGGDQLVHKKARGYFRLFPFVPGSHSKDVVNTASEAWEAAIQFGRFTKLLAGIQPAALKITLRGFHDLSLRYKQFTTALEKGNPQRIGNCSRVIAQVKDHAAIVEEYRRIKADPAFRLRVTHHDTKISNVLFDDSGKGICVIDLDTVMPGYFISDVGDMMRTYLSPVNEEEADFGKIEIRQGFYQAIVEGYYEEMKAELTSTEKNYFFYAGKYMIYMQAIRFFTDHLNNDIYYGARYPGHNLVRAQNQLVLLERFMEAVVPEPL